MTPNSTNLLLVGILSTSLAHAALDEFEKYRPYDHAYPELIRAQDYDTIKAIQTLGFKARHFQSTRGTRISESTIIFTGTTQREFSLTIEESYVQIGNDKFEDDGSIVLFRTVLNILFDYVNLGDSFEIRSDYWRGEGYINISEILLRIANNVIFIGENSGGIDNLENQYILDVVPLPATAFPEIKIVQ